MANKNNDKHKSGSYDITENVVGIILLIICGCLIIAAILVTIFRRDDVSNPPRPSYLGSGEWVTAPDPGEKGACQVYTFSPINLQGTILPPMPNLIFSNLNSMSGEITSCYDPDQIAAQLVNRTCVQNSSVPISAGEAVLCLQEGSYYPAGSVTTSFASCDIPPCGGLLVYLALGGDNINHCLTANDLSSSSGSNLTTSNCSLQNQKQLFRLTLLVPGSGSATPINGGGAVGTLAKITTRDGSYSLYPGSGTFQATLGGITLSLGDIAMVNISQVPNSGFVWAVLPANNTSNPGTTVPPQIVYIGNLPGLSLSTDPSLMSANQLISGGALSLYYGNNSKAGLGPFNAGDNIDINPYTTTNYLSMTNFNYYKTVAVCEQPGASGCLNL